MRQSRYSKGIENQGESTKAQFPQTEAAIIVAAQAIIGGLTANPTVLPALPGSAGGGQ